MDVVFARCAGIDVHKKTVVRCRLSVGADGQRHAETQTFGTTTDELLRLSDWLAAGGCTHVGVDSTGEYWKPVHNILDGSFEVWLLNAQHIKAATTDSPQWKHSGLDRHGRGDRSDTCF